MGVGGWQGTSGWLWEFLPGRTWAEFLWPDMCYRIIALPSFLINYFGQKRIGKPLFRAG
jgi:hypothetical protein